ncbi:type II toxin-antitoxin system mRNA interferase toxin, RelE/StbE family [Candidatus Falkowbacteria bacterium]|nr:type II toxin-antitoxin system mRNA interferase toxin, RelE/StbE family [Deltaproteobacteria bacterium]MBT4525426.1 type II toxin-antitoxin system mRNA interferase toxin, RelE/StbE family [Deltaproteobacteria bacterium]MBT7007083.1 type II toxin-antitoxin system mRNA interferase toxin, RelE/StbE family [Candidatus Falkowbacteria bacterium]
MLTIYYSTQFKKDCKRVKKQHKELSKFQTTIEILVNEKPLDPRYKDHHLIGDYIAW